MRQNHDNLERLSARMRDILRRCVLPGLHILNMPTGSGKSHGIAELACREYPAHFDNIIILCVQNKLILDMKDKISRYIDGSLLSAEDVLVVQNWKYRSDGTAIAL